MLKDTKTLVNGIEIPVIGFGTWQIAPGDEAYNAVRDALDVGYIHIDTAHAYENEESVGKAIKESGLKRSDIFITTKLPSHIKDYDGTISHFKESLKNLDTKYLDLYLIHAPWPWSDIGKDCSEGNVEVWKAMIDLYNDKLIRSIGVSNFSVDDIENIYKHTNFMPHVNQIQFHMAINQEEMLKYGSLNNILIEAYSPLGSGSILKDPLLVEMATKYKVTPARLAIKYTLQRGTVPLPKSVNKNRMLENSQMDFTISDSDMKTLKNYESKK